MVLPSGSRTDARGETYTRARKPLIPSPCGRGQGRGSPGGKLLAGDPLVALHVALGGAPDDLRRQLGRGRSLVPAGGLQIVTHVLFIEAILRFAGRVGLGWPEAAGVRRQQLVDQHELAVHQTELEFGVGQDYASLLATLGRKAEDAQAGLA